MLGIMLGICNSHFGKWPKGGGVRKGVIFLLKVTHLAMLSPENVH